MIYLIYPTHRVSWCKNTCKIDPSARMIQATAWSLKPEPPAQGHATAAGCRHFFLCSEKTRK